MLRISSGKITDIINDINGKTVDGIIYTKAGETTGLMAVFSTDAKDDELAKQTIKKYLKERFPVLRIYVEVI
jgi:hypothetical protein